MEKERDDYRQNLLFNLQGSMQNENALPLVQFQGGDSRALHQHGALNNCTFCWLGSWFVCRREKVQLNDHWMSKAHQELLRVMPKRTQKAWFFNEKVKAVRGCSLEWLLPWLVVTGSWGLMLYCQLPAPSLGYSSTQYPCSAAPTGSSRNP